MLDVPTRWTSTANMFERALEHQSSITHVLFERLKRAKKKDIEKIEIPWVRTRALLDALTPFKTVTVHMQSEEPTLEDVYAYLGGAFGNTQNAHLIHQKHNQIKSKTQFKQTSSSNIHSRSFSQMKLVIITIIFKEKQAKRPMFYFDLDTQKRWQ